MSRDRLLLEIIDEGPGFDPRAVRNPLAADQPKDRPGGWGLLLMRIYMNWVRFNRRGNRVVLCKHRSAP